MSQNEILKMTQRIVGTWNVLITIQRANHCRAIRKSCIARRTRSRPQALAEGDSRVVDHTTFVRGVRIEKNLLSFDK